ncbi:hypothetical protein GGR56DRAFT_640192, partial [Xylariaceae sp. FL0804]
MVGNLDKVSHQRHGRCYHRVCHRSVVPTSGAVFAFFSRWAPSRPSGADTLATDGLTDLQVHRPGAPGARQIEHAPARRISRTDAMLQYHGGPNGGSRCDVSRTRLIDYLPGPTHARGEDGDFLSTPYVYALWVEVFPAGQAKADLNNLSISPSSSHARMAMMVEFRRLDGHPSTLPCMPPFSKLQEAQARPGPRKLARARPTGNTNRDDGKQKSGDPDTPIERFNVNERRMLLLSWRHQQEPRDTRWNRTASKQANKQASKQKPGGWGVLDDDVGGRCLMIDWEAELTDPDGRLNRQAPSLGRE